jgi:hypothetical protein
MLACPAKALARASIVLAAVAAASSASPASAAAPRASPSARAPAPAATTPPAAAAAPRAADVPLPPPPAGTSLVAQSSDRDLRVTGLLGLATPSGNGGDASLMLAVDVARPWRTTPGGVALSWALPVRTILLQSDSTEGVKSGGVAFEVTPTLRASIPLGASKVRFRTDAGAGLASRFTWVETDVTFVGRRTETSSDLTGLVRVGLALDWAARPGLIVAFEPLSFGFDLDGNADWIFAAGASFRL